MGLANIIELSPLFLSLPTLFISLTLTSNLYNPNSIEYDPSVSFKDKYSIPILQSCLLSSLSMFVVALLLRLGIMTSNVPILTDAVSASLSNRLHKNSLIFIPVSLIFLIDQLVSPARLMNLLIIGMLIDNTKNKHISIKLEETYSVGDNTLLVIFKQYQVFIIYLISFSYDLVVSVLTGNLRVSMIVGYLLLLVPLFVFLNPLSSERTNSHLDYPDLKVSLIFVFVSLICLLGFNFEDFNMKMLFVSIGSSVIFIFSQLDLPNTNKQKIANQVFNKGLFIENHKTNLFILNFIILLIFHISLNGETDMHSQNITEFVDGLVKKNFFDFLLNVCLIYLIKPSRDSTLNQSSEKPEVKSEDKLHPNSTFLSLLVQLFNSKETKSIFNFLLLNISFMFIQLLYSFRSKSLSLLSDSLHMLLDCTSLFLGLLASLMAKNNAENPSHQYPFGLARIETLAGFTNGSLLLGIVFGILNESFQRIFNPVDLEKTDELLVVSVLGLVVNLVGIFAFNHGHDHGGCGHSHGHSHVQSNSPNSHSHSHDSDHSEKKESTDSYSDEKCDDGDENEANLNDNMHGIFLHIMADTLGSVGVIISTLVIRYTNYPVIDPITSIFIAVLVLASSLPLLKSSSANLLLSLDSDSETKLRDLLSDILKISGVKSYTTPRFWPVSDSSSKLTGYIHIQYYRTENSLTIRSKIDRLFKNASKISKVYIQFENEIDDCWCRKEGIFGTH